MTKRRFFAVIALGLAAVAAFWMVFGDPVALQRRSRLTEALTSAPAGTATLEAVVPFEWDAVYSFDPYTSAQEMAGVMGVPAAGLPETVSEGMSQLIFVQDGRVVCAVVGYPSRLGWRVQLPDAGHGYTMVRCGEGMRFEVTKSGEVTVWDAVG